MTGSVRGLGRIAILVFVVVATLISGWTAPTAQAVNGACKPTFTQAPGSPIPVTTPRSVAVGRLNADSFDDLAVADLISGAVTVLLGNGDGSFTQAPGSPIAVGAYPNSVAVGRLNADSVDDVVVANTSSNTVTILLGNGNGAFAQAPGSPTEVGHPIRSRWAASTAMASMTSL